MGIFFFLGLDFLKPLSSNHRIVRVGRKLWESSSLPLPKQGHLMGILMYVLIINICHCIPVLLFPNQQLKINWEQARFMYYPATYCITKCTSSQWTERNTALGRREKCSITVPHSVENANIPLSAAFDLSYLKVNKLKKI